MPGGAGGVVRVGAVCRLPGTVEPPHPSWLIDSGHHPLYHSNISTVGERAFFEVLGDWSGDQIMVT